MSMDPVGKIRDVTTDVPIEMVRLPSSIGIIPQLYQRNIPDLQRKVCDPLKAWLPRLFSRDEAFAHMYKNTEKTFTENTGDFLATVAEAMPAFDELKNFTQKVPLKTSIEVGIPQYQPFKNHPGIIEDTYCFVEVGDHFTLAGVFDGHGVKKGSATSNAVANFVTNEVKSVLSQCILENPTNIHTVLEQFIFDTQIKLKGKTGWQNLGTTASIVLLDKQNHLYYTLAIADSPTYVYRKFDEQFKSIPLSLQRDWKSKKDEQRVFKALEAIEMDKDVWIETNERLEKRRFPSARMGLNVSRSLGDVSFDQFAYNPIVCKPKITIQQAKPGDILMLRSDGVLLREVDIIALLQNHSATNTAQLIADESNQSPDDVTVIVIKVS
jgi:serine/threonine protein phosphatase PrpC